MDVAFKHDSPLAVLATLATSTSTNAAAATVVVIFTLTHPRRSLPPLLPLLQLCAPDPRAHGHVTFFEPTAVR